MILSNTISPQIIMHQLTERNNRHSYSMAKVYFASQRREEQAFQFGIQILYGNTVTIVLRGFVQMPAKQTPNQVY